MAQGEFTVEEADNAIECVNAIMDAVPKSKRAGLLGEANDLYLFLSRAKDEAKKQQEADADG